MKIQIKQHRQSWGQVEIGGGDIEKFASGLGIRYAIYYESTIMYARIDSQI